VKIANRRIGEEIGRVPKATGRAPKNLPRAVNSKKSGRSAIMPDSKITTHGKSGKGAVGMPRHLGRCPSMNCPKWGSWQAYRQGRR
jgi:hypothetical protein